MASADQRREVELPAGTIRYREAGEGRPVVFVHGFLVDGRLWDGVVDALADRCRCLAPDWPLGAQQVAAEAGRRPHPLRGRRDRRRLPRGARPGGRDDRRQRLRRGDVAGPRHPPPGADRPARADQLRHPRQLPAGRLQGAPRPGEDSGSDGGDARPGTHRRGRACCIQAVRHAHRSQPISSTHGRRRSCTTRASSHDAKKFTIGHEQALHAKRPPRSCAAPTFPCCSPGRRATSTSR